MDFLNFFIYISDLNLNNTQINYTNSVFFLKDKNGLEGVHHSRPYHLIWYKQEEVSWLRTYSIYDGISKERLRREHTFFFLCCMQQYDIKVEPFSYFQENMVLLIAVKLLKIPSVLFKDCYWSIFRFKGMLGTMTENTWSAMEEI